MTQSVYLPAKSAAQGRATVLMIVFIAGMAAATFFFSYKTDNADTVGYRPLLATVKRGAIQQVVPASGRIQPAAFVDIGAQVSGQLELLHVAIGEKVRKGQLLAEIDAAVQIAEVKASRARLKALEAQTSAREAALRLAQSDLARKEQLRDQGASSQADYDAAINGLAAARSSLVELQSQIDQSRASLASDEAQLGYSKIYAPTAGTVVSIEMTQGQTLNASQEVPTILRIADLSAMTVRAEVSEADIGSVKPGGAVYFTTFGSRGRQWQGEVSQILPTPSVEKNVVLYPVLFTVDNTDGALLPEMTAQVFFITGAVANTLIAPLGAVDITPDGTASVMVAAQRGDSIRPERRVVQLGLRSNIEVEVIEGLQEGEQVIAGTLDE